MSVARSLWLEISIEAYPLAWLMSDVDKVSHSDNGFPEHRYRWPFSREDTGMGSHAPDWPQSTFVRRHQTLPIIQTNTAAK